MRLVKLGIQVAVIGTFCSVATVAWAVDPNPLQNAYWRFEEGPADAKVPPNENVVLDWYKQNDPAGNHLRAFMDATNDASPTYTADVPPKPLQSGLPNTLALDFIPNPGLAGGDDLYSDGRQINNGIIGGDVAPDISGFTIEAAFKSFNPARWGAIIGKEGLPVGGDLPTLVLKTSQEDSRLRLQQYDKAGNLVTIDSVDPLNAQQWYYTAVVNDGSQVSLWLDSGNGYELQGTAPVSGALYQGASDDWDYSWTIGRSVFGDHPDENNTSGAASDWFDGIIDEVRLSNSALSPSQFLFAPPPTELVGDYNGDGSVDAADYVAWRRGNIDGAAGYEAWMNHFGESQPGAGGTAGVPEPAALAIAGLAACAAGFMRRRRAEPALGSRS